MSYESMATTRGQCWANKCVEAHKANTAHLTSAAKKRKMKSKEKSDSIPYAYLPARLPLKHTTKAVAVCAARYCRKKSPKPPLRATSLKRAATVVAKARFVPVGGFPDDAPLGFVRDSPTMQASTYSQLCRTKISKSVATLNWMLLRMQHPVLLWHRDWRYRNTHPRRAAALTTTKFEAFKRSVSTLIH